MSLKGIYIVPKFRVLIMEPLPPINPARLGSQAQNPLSGTQSWIGCALSLWPRGPRPCLAPPTSCRPPARASVKAVKLRALGSRSCQEAQPECHSPLSPGLSVCGCRVRQARELLLTTDSSLLPPSRPRLLKGANLPPPLGQPGVLFFPAPNTPPPGDHASSPPKTQVRPSSPSGSEQLPLPS